MSSWTSFVSTHAPDPNNNFLSSTGTLVPGVGTVTFTNVDFTSFPTNFWVSVPNSLSCTTKLSSATASTSCSSGSTSTKLFYSFTSLTTLDSTKWIYFQNFVPPNAVCDLFVSFSF